MYGFVTRFVKDETTVAKMYGKPAQRDEEAPPPKKERKYRLSDWKRPCGPLILGRRYNLTPTKFKYLEIGISVGIQSDVEVIIGDDHGAPIILPIDTWKTLVKKRSDILRLLDESSPPPLYAHDLTVEVCTIYGSKMFQLTLWTTYLYFEPTAMKNLFNLEHCVEHMYASLMEENIHLVNRKCQNFVNVLRDKNITEICNAAKAIRESDMFDGASIIDCELLTCALNNIMYEAGFYEK